MLYSSSRYDWHTPGTLFAAHSKCLNWSCSDTNHDLTDKWLWSDPGQSFAVLLHTVPKLWHKQHIKTAWFWAQCCCLTARFTFFRWNVLKYITYLCIFLQSARGASARQLQRVDGGDFSVMSTLMSALMKILFHLRVEPAWGPKNDLHLDNCLQHCWHPPHVENVLRRVYNGLRGSCSSSEPAAHYNVQTCDFYYHMASAVCKI